MDADHRDEPRTLQDAVGLGVSAAGEDLLGVRVAADGQESVGQGQRDVSPTGLGEWALDGGRWGGDPGPDQMGGCGVQVLLDGVQAARDELQAVRGVAAGGAGLGGDPVRDVLDESADRGQGPACSSASCASTFAS
ncbi:hypothetical protein [Streptomyces sp. C8S0]|uniref:hypothetical protein n=1 Tax=Streptomyces sp. C8S0 TaxID=2585716 RepID=UPI0018662222|nr:hypothetical protein [Streptomyces sp. C8S0]